MEAVEIFAKELRSLSKCPLPVSRQKMILITKAAMRAIRLYKHVVQLVGRYISKCPPLYKVAGLYALDAIVRHSIHQYHERDVYVPRFTRELPEIVRRVAMDGVNTAHDRAALSRVLNLWFENRVFDSELVMALRDYAANPELGESHMARAEQIVNKLINQQLNLKGQSSETVSSSVAPAAVAAPVKVNFQPQRQSAITSLPLPQRSPQPEPASNLPRSPQDSDVEEYNEIEHMTFISSLIDSFRNLIQRAEQEGFERFLDMQELRNIFYGDIAPLFTKVPAPAIKLQETGEILSQIAIRYAAAMEAAAAEAKEQTALLMDSRQAHRRLLDDFDYDDEDDVMTAEEPIERPEIPNSDWLIEGVHSLSAQLNLLSRRKFNLEKREHRLPPPHEVHLPLPYVKEELPSPSLPTPQQQQPQKLQSPPVVADEVLPPVVEIITKSSPQVVEIPPEKMSSPDEENEPPVSESTMISLADTSINSSTRFVTESITINSAFLDNDDEPEQPSVNHGSLTPHSTSKDQDYRCLFLGSSDKPTNAIRLNNLSPFFSPTAPPVDTVIPTEPPESQPPPPPPPKMPTPPSPTVFDYQHTHHVMNDTPTETSSSRNGDRTADSSHRRRGQASRGALEDGEESGGVIKRSRMSPEQSLSRERHLREQERKRRGFPPLRNGRVSVLSRTVFIGRLNKNIQEDKLREVLQEYGSLSALLHIPPRGCAFATYQKRKKATKAVRRLHKKLIEGREIRVEWAPNKGINEDPELKEFWDKHEGCTYIPQSKLPVEELERVLEGGAELDELSISETLSAKLREVALAREKRLQKEKDRREKKEREEKTAASSQQSTSANLQGIPAHILMALPPPPPPTTIVAAPLSGSSFAAVVAPPPPPPPPPVVTHQPAPPFTGHPPPPPPPPPTEIHTSIPSFMSPIPPPPPPPVGPYPVNLSVLPSPAIVCPTLLPHLAMRPGVPPPGFSGW